jgi:hypothetical protein
VGGGRHPPVSAGGCVGRASGNCGAGRAASAASAAAHKAGHKAQLFDPRRQSFSPKHRLIIKI